MALSGHKEMENQMIGWHKRLKATNEALIKLKNFSSLVSLWIFKVESHWSAVTETKYSSQTVNFVEFVDLILPVAQSFGKLSYFDW